MAILDGSIVNVALPKIMAVMGSTPDQIQWVLTSYMLTLGVIMPITGFLGDRFGTKKMYLLALGLFTFGSALCGMAWNTASLVAARVLQGLGGGILTPLGMAIIFKAFDRSQIGTALGIWGIASMAAPAIGPTLGGYIVEYSNWRLIFLINLPIGILNLFLGALLLQESPLVKGHRFDYVGLITAMGGFSLLLYAISNGTEKGWTSPLIVSLLLLAFILLVVLVINELFHPEPVLDFRLFKNFTFSLSVLIGSIAAMGMFGALFLLPLFLQTLSGLSALQVGILLFPAAIASGLAMPISGALFDRFGPRLIVPAGMAVVAITTYCLSQLTLITPLGTIALWMAIRGVGLGFSMMPANTAGMNTVPPHLVNRASALSNVIRQVAASLGIAMFTTIMQQRQAFHLHSYAAAVQLSSSAGTELISKIQFALLNAGVSPLQSTGVAASALASLLVKQAMAQAIDDCFLIAALIIAAGIIPSFFLIDVRKKQKPALQTGSPLSSSPKQVSQPVLE